METRKWNDIYEISIDGTVRNIKTNRNLKTFLAGVKYGYSALRLGAGKKYYIHKLVALCFLPSPTDNNCQIDHIDRNRLNNHASNLRWVSNKVNINNRNLESKARPNNRLNQHHIRKDKWNKYIVSYQSKKFKHYSYHNTLEEAINKRDEVHDYYLSLNI